MKSEQHRGFIEHCARPGRQTSPSLPSEDSAVVLLFCRVASGQIKLRRIDGWRKIAGMLGQRPGVAA
jgi:hypothetical protein